MRERAQSDVLGFVFVFAIIVSAIGLVFTTGFAGLQDARDFERVNNAERALEVFKDNMDDMLFRGAPSRGTEIKLADASLEFGDPITVNVSEDGGTFNTSQEIRPLVFDGGTNARIVYAGGAIIRQQGGNAVVLHESNLLLTENRTLIPIIQTRQDGTSGISGDTTVLIRTVVSQRNVLYTSDNSAVTLWVNVTTPRAGAWRNSLSDRADVTCEPVVDDTAACQVTTDRAFVTRISLDVALT